MGKFFARAEPAKAKASATGNANRAIPTRLQRRAEMGLLFDLVFVFTG
jgi:hypothetical protein